jgi:hypothetical protein
VRKWQFTTIAVCVTLWVFVCGALLFMLWPWRPTTLMQWLLFILIGPLVYAAVEYIGERIFSAKVASRISQRRFSWLRITYALFALLAVLAVAFGGLRLLGISPLA